jgi:hypothetical protein
VLKKNGKLRLILDARKSNAYFRRPPGGNNSSFASLSNVRVPREKTLFISQCDVKDFFFRLQLPLGLEGYFGLPSISFSEAQSVFDVEELKLFGEDSSISPHFKVLPMGFSWSFYLAQEALRTVVKRAVPDVRFITDFCSPPDLTDPSPVVMIYADNGNHVGLSADDVDRSRKKVEDELSRVGLATHEIMEATELATTLGGRIDGAGLRAGPTSARLQKIRGGLLAIVKGRAISGKDMEHMVGHILTIALISRLSMSIIQHCYDFIRDSYHHKIPVWKSVLTELRLIHDVLPLCFSFLAEGVHPFYVCD